jgi:hypothetical protein
MSVFSRPTLFYSNHADNHYLSYCHTPVRFNRRKSGVARPKPAIYEQPNALRYPYPLRQTTRRSAPLFQTDLVAWADAVYG